MKIIEAMKRVKLNKEKIADLQSKIAMASARLDFETPLYGDKQQETVDGWLQACTDITQDNIKLLTGIARTNLATPVTITLGDKAVTKSIAEWVWRRREYARMDFDIWSAVTDRGLKEGNLPSPSGGEPRMVKIIRYYDPTKRDKMLETFRMEPHLIDAALEVVNAVTDLIEE